MMNAVSRAPGEDTVLGHLADAGCYVNSLAGLRQSGVKYASAVPLLIAALDEAVDPALIEEIARTLSVPWARPAAIPALVTQISEAIQLRAEAR